MSNKKVRWAAIDRVIAQLRDKEEFYLSDNIQYLFIRAFNYGIEDKRDTEGA